MNPMKDSLMRLLQLLDDPQDIGVLSELRLKEFYYQILKSPYGNLLRNCVKSDSRAHKIVPVVHYLEQNFTHSIEIQTLSEIAKMSSSSLHEHFKRSHLFISDPVC